MLVLVAVLALLILRQENFTCIGDVRSERWKQAVVTAVAAFTGDGHRLAVAPGYQRNAVNDVLCRQQCLIDDEGVE